MAHRHDARACVSARLEGLTPGVSIKPSGAEERRTAAVTVDRSRGRALVFARQVFQHGIAGVLGLGEGFKRQATNPDCATALVKRTP
jgi:hypothetical protein